MGFLERVRSVSMKVFVPNQTVPDELRVAMVPAAAKKLISPNVQVCIEARGTDVLRTGMKPTRLPRRKLFLPTKVGRGRMWSLS